MTTNADMSEVSQPVVPRRRNWWKIGFFILLLFFEVAREWAVIASSQTAQPNASAHVVSYEGYTVAQGRWKRIDGGSPIVPTTVTIDCRRELRKCVEATTTMSELYVYAPQLDWFNATFGADAVTYENDVPECARYSVRIDLKLKKAFAVRERKTAPSNPECAKLEPRVEMQMADGYDSGKNPAAGHIVPIFAAIRALIN
jgi:hypothetical protein